MTPVPQFRYRQEQVKGLFHGGGNFRVRIFVAGVRLLLCLVVVAASLLGGEAARLYREGQEAERAEDMARAYLLYAHAAALEPNNGKYWGRAQALRTRAALQAKTMPPALAPPETHQRDDEDLKALLGRITAKELAEASRPQPPVELAASPDRKSFDLKSDSKQLFEQVARAYGLDVIFDADYEASAPLRFRVEDADHREALRALEVATGSFLIPVSERLAMVAKDTTQKRQELENTMAIVIPIPTAVSVQEAQELARSVQQLMEIQKFVVDSTRRMVLLRDRVSKVRPAQLIFEQLLHHRPQVSVEVDFLEVAESSNLSYGLRLQTSSPLVWLSRIWNSTLSIPSGILGLATFGAGKTFFGLGLSDIELFAAMSRSSVRNLLKAEIRSVDGQPATFHLGDKYPILTNGYFGATQGSGEVFTPPPSFTFEDLGLMVKVTPHVHGRKEVTLEIDAEFKVLTGQTLNGIPVIANRKIQSVARMKIGEEAILAGLLRTSEARTITGLAGLSQLPVLGPLVRQNDRTQDMGQTLLVLKPKLLSLPPTEVVTNPIWTGTETRPRTPL